MKTFRWVPHGGGLFLVDDTGGAIIADVSREGRHWKWTIGAGSFGAKSKPASATGTADSATAAGARVTHLIRAALKGEVVFRRLLHLHDADLVLSGMTP